MELKLDNATLACLHWLSTARNCTAQEIVVEAIRKLAAAEVENYPLLGGWEEDAEVVDDMLAEVAANRTHQPIGTKDIEQDAA